MIFVQPPKFMKPTEKNVPLSKTITLFYKLVHLLFSFDFGFFDCQKAKVRFLVKYFMPFFNVTLCMSILVCAFCNYIEIGKIYTYTIHSVQYSIYILILIFTKNQLFKCLCEMGAIDSKLNVNTATHNFEIKLVLPALLSLVFRICLTVSYCFLYDRLCLSPVWPFFSLLTEVGRDLLLITNSFAYYSLQRRLKTMSFKLGMDRTNLIFYHNIYKTIADVSERIKASFDPLIAAALLFNIPSIMTMIYLPVQRLHNHEYDTTTDLQLKNVAVIETLFLTIAPALFASKLSSEANKIKVILHEKWLQEQDPVEARNIVKFIDYVEARPLVFYVYKIIPLNANLLSMILNFCVTYLIVIIQFAHLY